MTRTRSFERGHQPLATLGEWFSQRMEYLAALILALATAAGTLGAQPWSDQRADRAVIPVDHAVWHSR